MSVIEGRLILKMLNSLDAIKWQDTFKTNLYKITSSYNVISLAIYVEKTDLGRKYHMYNYDKCYAMSSQYITTINV